MNSLLFSILASTLIFVIFKLFQKFKIDVFQAVVFNYFSAFTCGYLFFNSDFQQDIRLETWWYYALILGTLFIVIFNFMGRSSQSNGIGLTSIATKMSLLISIIFTILYYNESVTIFKILGIISAVASIIFVSFPKKGAKLKESGILLIIFLGSGLIEIIIGLTNKTVISSDLQSVFTASSFLAAGIMGFIVFIIQVLRKKTKFHLKSILAGLILGIPNFFSIYALYVALEGGFLEPSSIFGIMNISIVVLSFIIGILFFKEKVKTIHYFGVIMAIAAIAFFMQ